MMTADEFAEQNKTEIQNLRTAARIRKETKFNFSRIAKSEESTDEQIEQAGQAAREANNEWMRLDTALNMKAEKQIGRGKELGRFYETYIFVK